MKAYLKEILASDTMQELCDYRPENPEYFCIGVSMMIGDEKDTFGDIFYAQVCSFDWFYHRLKGQQKTFHNRNKIIMESYDYQAIMGHINQIVAMYDESDWHSLAKQLNKYFLWEFDEHLVC